VEALQWILISFISEICILIAIGTLIVAIEKPG